MPLGSKPKGRRNARALDFGVKQRKRVPHEFVLSAVSALSPRTRSMFGCLAIYVEEKIVLILRDKNGEDADSGVWLATTEEHHERLRRGVSPLRALCVFRDKG